jgi:hypothetical protein
MVTLVALLSQEVGDGFLTSLGNFSRDIFPSVSDRPEGSRFPTPNDGPLTHTLELHAASSIPRSANVTCLRMGDLLELSRRGNGSNAAAIEYRTEPDTDGYTPGLIPCFSFYLCHMLLRGRMHPDVAPRTHSVLSATYRPPKRRQQ